ncbi:MAG: hypothetical protein NTY66_04595, partial [Candidatus Vogelbacteria bacterium]|nr:hypothetical protein [Candidatus Vogelbacteria bacterium]
SRTNMIYLVWVALVSGLTISTMVGVRLFAIKNGRHTEFEQPALFTAIQERIDWLAVLLVLLFREGLRYLSIRLLYGVRKFGSYLKIAGIKIEKRFEKVIDLVHGKKAVGKKGAVSFFLREIAEHKKSSKTRIPK